MPALTVSWDLSIVVVFAIVMSFVFIIGKQQSVKIIIAAYIGIIAVQGIGNVLGRLLGSSEIILQSIGMEGDTSILPLAKIFLFALCIIVFVLKSGIDLTFEHEGGIVINIIATALFGFAMSGLIVSTVLTYAAGSAILDSSLLTSPTVLPLLQESTLMQLMILNQDIWYTLPAFLIIVVGFLQSAEDE